VPVNKTTDIVSALRAILLARAEGKITPEEFERRQAEIHALVLASSPGQANEKSPSAGISRSAEQGTSRRPPPKWLILIPLVAFMAGIGLYFVLAKPGSVANAPAETVQKTGTGADAVNAPQIEQQIKTLTAEVTKNPMNGEAWADLARSHSALGQHAPAADAFAKAAAILPPDASLLSDWADAYVVAHNRQWDETSRALVKRALAADPKFLKALSLAATDAFDNANYAGAIGYWKRMKDAVPSEASVQKYADANIAEATAVMTGNSVNTADAPLKETAAGPAKAASAAIAGAIVINEKLRAKTLPTDTVFVFAKATEGQGPPLAVKRYPVADLPVDFRLDDDASMVPGRGLSSVIEAVVSARVSRSGNPIAQPGDLESAAQRLKVGASGIRLEINSTR
jgi:cytochrome c-type biogenesis protein CcmH